MAGDEVEAFISTIANERRRRDAKTLLDMMSRVSGQPARLSGTAIGFGSYHYHYPSGRQGDAAALGFAPRKAACTVYLMDGVGAHRELLERLGPHTTGVGCLYLKDLAQVDLGVLEEILTRTYATLTSGTFGQRAREGGQAKS